MKRSRRQEGAVLFVVLMIVMVGTASAVFSASTVSHEVRGTGFARQQMQTRYASKAGLVAAIDWFDIFGPNVVRDLMLQPGSTDGVQFPQCTSGTCYPEVPMAPGRRAYRIVGDHFTALEQPIDADPPRFLNSPFTKAASFGAQTARTPIVEIDIYDERVTNRLTPGAAAQGGGKFKYMRATMTARARAQVGGDVVDADDLGRQHNETGASYRAYVIGGPFVPGQ
ncbi:MAG: hypothetical protein WBG86_11260 [Polyangiales bacterium]